MDGRSATQNGFVVVRIVLLRLVPAPRPPPPSSSSSLSSSSSSSASSQTILLALNSCRPSPAVISLVFLPFLHTSSSPSSAFACTNWPSQPPKALLTSVLNAASPSRPRPSPSRRPSQNPMHRPAIPKPRYPIALAPVENPYCSCELTIGPVGRDRSWRRQGSSGRTDRAVLKPRHSLKAPANPRATARFLSVAPVRLRRFELSWIGPGASAKIEATKRLGLAAQVGQESKGSEGRRASGTGTRSSMGQSTDRESRADQLGQAARVCDAAQGSGAFATAALPSSNLLRLNTAFYTEQCSFLGATCVAPTLFGCGGWAVSLRPSLFAGPRFLSLRTGQVFCLRLSFYRAAARVSLHPSISVLFLSLFAVP